MINVNKLALLPIAVSLLISSCETSTKRDCPAFFHPDYDKWAQRSIGEALVFTDQNGVTEIFTVTSIERNDIFQTEDFGSQESDIVCDLAVDEMLVREDLNETILKFFDHGERSDRDLADENFTLNIDFSTGAREQRLYDFSIDLGVRPSVVVSEINEQTRHEELQIGDVLYQDVITDEILDERFLAIPEQVRSVAIANGFGLVQYTRVNGSVFSRIR